MREMKRAISYLKWFCDDPIEWLGMIGFFAGLAMFWIPAYALGAR